MFKLLKCVGLRPTNFFEITRKFLGDTIKCSFRTDRNMVIPFHLNPKSAS